MSKNKAILDFIGLPVGQPGNIEVRLQKASFRDDGTWIDDGSRSGPMQREKHRIMLSRGMNIRRSVEQTNGYLLQMGYDPPDVGMIRHVAQYEWRQSVISARRTRLKVNRPELRFIVRALGFDIEGRGELAIGIGKATVRPDGVMLTQKNSVLLYPGDPLPLVFEAIDAVAENTGYQTICDEDKNLVKHVADKLWTVDAISKRRNAWVEADMLNGDRAEQVRMVEFVQRLDTLSKFFNTVPIGNPNELPAYAH